MKTSILDDDKCCDDKEGTVTVSGAQVYFIGRSQERSGMVSLRFHLSSVLPEGQGIAS